MLKAAVITHTCHSSKPMLYHMYSSLTSCAAILPFSLFWRCSMWKQLWFIKSFFKTWYCGPFYTLTLYIQCIISKECTECRMHHEVDQLNSQPNISAVIPQIVAGLFLPFNKKRMIWKFSGMETMVLIALCHLLLSYSSWPVSLHFNMHKCICTLNICKLFVALSSGECWKYIFSITFDSFLSYNFIQFPKCQHSNSENIFLLFCSHSEKRRKRWDW